MKSIIATCFLTALLLSCNSINKDQFVGNWIEVMPANPQIVQGVTLNADGSASSIGMATLLYEKWKPEADNMLILWGKSVGNGQTIDFSDTLNIIKVTPDSLILGKFGSYRICYTKAADLNNIKPFNVLDSLKLQQDCGEVIERKYQGILPAASCPGIEYTLFIHNQQHSGDGVYKLTQRYIEAEDGKDKSVISYGRQYTLRGDAVNPDAVVYQLVPFGWGETVNFLLEDNNLVLLNAKLERAKSELNYTLTLQK